MRLRAASNGLAALYLPPVTTVRRSAGLPSHPDGVEEINASVETTNGSSGVFMDSSPDIQNRLSSAARQMYDIRYSCYQLLGMACSHKVCK